MGWKIKAVCPFTRKYQLVDWATRKYPNWTTSRIIKMSKKQLFAIWHKS